MQIVLMKTYAYANALLALDYNMGYEFKKVFIRVLNNAPFMNRTLSKAFMHRSTLKNRYNKKPTEANKTSYNQQRNYCFTTEEREKEILQ